VLGVAFVLVAWVAAWKVASDRAENELLETQNRLLVEQIASNKAYAARMTRLEEQKRALDENEPAYARMLPIAEVATDQKLLTSVSDIAQVSGVRLLSVEVRR
jgi:Tfp pilus assembly protein PilN